MALAVLSLSATTVLASSSRVLGSEEWQTITDAAQLRERAEHAFEQAREQTMQRSWRGNTRSLPRSTRGSKRAPCSRP